MLTLRAPVGKVPGVSAEALESVKHETEKYFRFEAFVSDGFVSSLVVI